MMNTPLNVLGETIRVTDEMREAEARLHAARTEDETLGAVRDLERLELRAVEERDRRRSENAGDALSVIRRFL